MTLVETSPETAVLDVTCYTFSPFPVLMVGNSDQLGNWDPGRGLPLKFTGSVRGREQWQGTVEVPLGQAIEFKFVHQGTDGPEWELGANRAYTAESPKNFLDSYFRTGNETWQRLLAGDRVIGGGNLTARGDIVRALEVLVFLANSADRGVRPATLDSISAKAASALRYAVAAEGHDADKDISAINALKMVNAGSSREIVVAHVPTGDLDQSSIDLIVEDAAVVGCLYRNPIW